MSDILRNHPLCVVSKEIKSKRGARSVQSNSVWTKNPYGDAYAIVPDELVEGILATDGFCDIVLNEDGTEIVSFAALEKPEIPVEPVVDEPTADELFDILLGRNE